MKKTTRCLIAVLCLVSLTGCYSELEKDITGSESSDTGNVRSSETEEELPPFTMEFAANRICLADYQEQYEEEIREIMETEYRNLNFQDCAVLPLGEVERVGVYRLCSGEMGAEESIADIKNWLSEIGCEDIDLERELRDASGQYEGSDGQYPYDYPAVYDYYPEFDSGHGFFINTNECYIQMGAEGIYSMSDGSITAYLKLNSLAAMDALGVNQQEVIERGSVTEKGDEVWELADGEMSVADGAAVVKSYFEAGTPRQNPAGISVDVPEVRVFALGDKYGYEFLVRRVYNGIPFAYTGGGARTYYSSDYTIDEDMKTASIIYHDTVAAFTGYVEAQQLEALLEEQSDILSLTEAASLLDNFLAAKVRLEVRTTGLVYCTLVDEDGNKTVYPCWQFEGINTTNNQSLRTYVNVLSGEIYYYSYVEE